MQEVRSGLLDEIMLKIDEKRRQRARVRLVCFGVLSILALSALVPAWRELNSEIAGTGFSQFFSLLFSDAGILAAYWQDFMMVLAESFPILGMSAVLASLFAFLASVRIVVKNKDIAFI